MPDLTPTTAPAAPKRERRETVSPVRDPALRVAPAALLALIASSIAVVVVLVTMGFSMGRATRPLPVLVECRCPGP